MRRDDESDDGAALARVGFEQISQHLEAATVESTTITVDPRYQGPVGHGNGGYVAGLLAARLGGDGTARLRAMTPLDIELTIAPEERGLRLLDGDRVLVEMTAATASAEPPPPVSLAAAEEATQRSPALMDHGAPGCFGCGPDQPQGIGLRQFPGPVADSDLAAALWIAPPDLVGPGGTTPVEIVWAALDCPGGWALGLAGILGDRFPALTRQTVRLHAPVHPGERLITVARPVPSDLDRPEAVTAVYGLEGDLRASAHLVHAAVPRAWAGGGKRD